MDDDYMTDGQDPLLYGDSGFLDPDEQFAFLAEQNAAEQQLAGLVLGDPLGGGSAAGNGPLTWAQIIEAQAAAPRRRKKKGKMPTPNGGKNFGAGVLLTLAENKAIVGARTWDEFGTTIVGELARLANRPVLGATPAGPMLPPAAPKSSWIARNACVVGAGVLVVGLGLLFIATRGAK
jgi:hypothetical protein